MYDPEDKPSPRSVAVNLIWFNSVAKPVYGDDSFDLRRFPTPSSFKAEKWKMLAHFMPDADEGSDRGNALERHARLIDYVINYGPKIL